MADDDIRRVLSRAGEETGPPMGIDPRHIIEQGGRIRRRRKRFTVAGAFVATAGTVAAITFAVTPALPDTPVVPAGPGLTVESPVPSPVPPPPSTAVPSVTEPPAPESSARPEPSRTPEAPGQLPSGSRSAEREPAPPAPGQTASETRPDEPATVRP
ncbi:hypothetical protein [Amycolatopsis antarctica]|uniref:hypothetical protein n=1 Tax=Amycolatopsis antarctica TaxID=1854586 RepID=UPI00105680DC|nr:hypothetical protein [Amycolatopsis antarctica]